MKEKNNKSKFIFIIKIFLILIIISCYIYILLWYLENKHNSTVLNEISDSSILDTITIQIPNNDISNSNDASTQTQITAYELDFDKLLSINSSTVGWLSVPNTSVNYPVVRGNDNSFYLTHSFDKSKNSAGWIFADYRNKFDGTDKNIIIYGHNRMDSSMFGTLRNTQKSNWYTDSNNKYITFSTPNGTKVYEIFSTYTIKMETYYLKTQFQNGNDFLEFLKTLESRSIHNFDVDLTENDNILTLSTCDSTGKSRIIIHAKQII